MQLLLGAVGNGRFFGGGMKICPEAMLNDGWFDLVTVGNLSRVGIMANLHRLYSGDHLTMKEVQGARARRIKVAPADADAKIPIDLGKARTRSIEETSGAVAYPKLGFRLTTGRLSK
jgi:diacylglycerol kinase family enzyme